jgi:hypothetical protein
VDDDLSIDNVSSAKSNCYQFAADFVLKNPEYLLVHGVVSNVTLSDVPHAWVKKGSKIYHVEDDKWYDLPEWEKRAVEQKVYTYEEVAQLIAFTGHSGPWTEDERDRSK